MSRNVRSLQRFLAKSAGLALAPEQFYLAESRLLPLAQSWGFTTVDSLLGELDYGVDATLAQAAIEAMTTHETLFFRDRTLWAYIRGEILPQLMIARAQSRRIRIWCAACSTGQEPYSLAMLLDEEGRKLAGWSIEILATDLSHGVIAAAREAVYSQFEVQRGLSIQHLLRHFQRDGEKWRLNEHLRARVDFRQHNLIRDFSALGAFDLVLCRNVLIYFGDSTRRDVLGRVGGVINEAGYLALGASERLGGDAPGLATVISSGLDGAIAKKVNGAPSGQVLPFPAKRAGR